MLRRTLKDDEIRLYKEQMEALNIFQQRLDDIWKSARWITNVASNARDRHINCGLPLGVLFAYSEAPETTPDNGEEQQSDNSDPDAAEDNSDVGYHSDQSIDKAGSSAPQPVLPFVSVQPAVANPTYDFPNVGENTTATDSSSMYVNLQSTTSNAWCSTPSTPTGFTTAQPWPTTPTSHSPNSYLQPRFAANRRHLVPATLERANSDPNALQYGGSKPLSPLVRHSHDHEYVNCQETPHSSDSESTISIGASRHQTVSDTEAVLKSRRSEPRLEDLSAIDQLYVQSQRPPQMVRSSTASPTTTMTPTAGSSRASSNTPLANGVVRVYAAYPCGLARGTSVKLQITPKTTAKEVVALVVQQLNKAVQMKALPGPIYSEQDWVDFCLVAVIGARERCLRDDFAPLQLQNPWAKGRLFVRRRDNLLAALEFGNEAKV